jgi:hypothetical protein
VNVVAEISAAEISLPLYLLDEENSSRQLLGQFHIRP